MVKASKASKIVGHDEKRKISLATAYIFQSLQSNVTKKLSLNPLQVYYKIPWFNLWRKHLVENFDVHSNKGNFECSFYIKMALGL